MSYTHIVKNAGPIGYRNVECTGDESSLIDCPKETSPDLDQCNYDSNDAGVVCYNATGKKIMIVFFSFRTKCLTGHHKSA